MKTMTIILLVLFGVSAVNAQYHHETENNLTAKEINADHSVYHLDSEWTDHRGSTITLSDFKGKPVIVVMFYGNCTEVCPILIRDSWRLYSSLDESQQASVNVLAVSFDTINDTPDVLREYAEYEQLNIPGWHFMTSDNASVRSLAMMLGVQYSKKSDGHFAHSNLVTVLDEEGRVVKRVEGLNQPMDEAAAAIESIIKKQLQ